MKNSKFNETELRVYKIIGEKISSKRKTTRKKLPGISKKLNISVDHLNLIEKGDVSDLPKYTLINGFIKTYAKFIGADLTDEFSKLEKKKVKGQVDNRKTIFNKVSLKHLIIFICIFFLVLIFFYNN